MHGPRSPRTHMDVTSTYDRGSSSDGGEVEEDAAEAVVLAILGVLREGLVVDELGEFALEDERRTSGLGRAAGSVGARDGGRRGETPHDG